MATITNKDKNISNKETTEATAQTVTITQEALNSLINQATAPKQSGTIQVEDKAAAAQNDRAGVDLIKGIYDEYSERVNNKDRVMKLRYGKGYAGTWGIHTSFSVNLLKYTFQHGLDTWVLEEHWDIINDWLEEKGKASGTKITTAEDVINDVRKESNSNYTLTAE